MAKTGNTIFIERKEELQKLRDFACDALSGQAGVAFVSGEAGIGKTALVEELQQRLKEEYGNLVAATGPCSTGGESYFPFRTIIRDLARGNSELLAKALRDAGSHLAEVFLPSEAGIRTAFNECMPERFREDLAFTLPEDLEQVQLFGWYTQVMKNISRHIPLVLVIEDLQWADRSSLHLLSHLGHEIEKEQILIIGTYRPQKTAPKSLLMQLKNTLKQLLPLNAHYSGEGTPVSFPGQIRMKLEPYGAKEFSLDTLKERSANTLRFIHEYLLAKYATHFSQQFEQFLVEISEGNALFLIETLLDFEEKGRIKKVISEKTANSGIGRDEEWELPTEFECIKNFPENIGDIINRRLTRQEEPHRQILNYACVQGNNFIPEVIPDFEQEELHELLSKFMKPHPFIQEQEARPLSNGKQVHTWSFRHSLIRECLYQQLPLQTRTRLHAEIGRGLERLYEPNSDEIALDLARHFYHGGVSKKAVHYCLKTAEDANKRLGTPEAVRFGLMGLHVLEEKPEEFSRKEYASVKWRLLLELAKAEGLGGDKLAGKDHIRKGIAYLDDHLPVLHVDKDELYAEIYTQLGKLYSRHQGDQKQEAREYFEKAIYIYTQKNDQKHLAEVLFQLAGVSQTDKAIETLEKSYAFEEQLQDIGLQIRCLQRLTRAYADSYFSHAEEYAQQALLLAKQNKDTDNYLKIKALNLMALICRENGKFQTGIRYLEESLELARQRGDIFLEAAILNDLGCDYGRFVIYQKKAQGMLEKSIAIRERAGLSKSAPLCNLGWILTRHGKWNEAQTCFQQAIEEADERAQVVYRGNIARLYELQGNYAQAELELFYQLEVLERYDHTDKLFGYAELSQNYALLGDEKRSKGYMQMAQTLFEQETRPRRKWWCLYEIADGHRILGKFDAAKAACQQSLDWFLSNAEGAEKLIYAAEAQFVMGKILVDMNAHQDALPYLHNAKSAFELCHHYALGETLLYLGKAHQGLGGAEMISQARQEISTAITEFQRLLLHRKEREAKDVLDNIRSLT